MSNQLSETTHADACDQPECDVIELLIAPRTKDLGGFNVRRILPYAKRRMVGPFIFFDHLGPATFEPQKGIDVRPHPHINLATVTYLFEGSLMHRDSLGTVQNITPGAINLMTAGRGITHSERSSDEVRATTETLHALQLWLALPEDQAECEPAFAHYAADTLPQLRKTGASIRVMIGSAHGASSPVTTYSPTLYVEYQLDAGVSIELPPAQERAIYIVSGEVEIRRTPVPQHHMAVLAADEEIQLYATQDTRVVLIGGDTVGERHIWWNFIAATQERIEQAKQDWKNGNFPSVPGEDEFIPLPE